MRNDLSAVKAMLNEKAAEAQEDSQEEIQDEIQEEETKEEITEEIQDDAQEEQETDEEDEAGEEEEVVTGEDPYTMKSLAEAIEIDQQDLYGVMVPLRDGSTLSIGEIKNQYQDMVKEQDGLKAKVTELESAQTQIPQQAQVSQAEFQAQIEMSKVQEEFNNTDWADLDEFDPGKSALLRQQFNDRYNNAQNVMYQANQQRTAEHATFLQEQKTKMLELVPEWTDTDTRSKDMDKIADIMTGAGYPQEVIDSNTDPISLKLLHELMTLRAEKEVSAKLVKRVKGAPKPLNAKKLAPANKQTELKNIIKKAKTGSKYDKEAAVKALFKQAYGE